MCKMAHFGNCDPETADQEYCIFHKPNKSEEEAVEFYRKFLERFKPRVEEIEVNGRKIKRLVFEEPVDAGGFVFPKSPNVPVEYKGHNRNKWEEIFSFRFTIFKKGATFTQATFENYINFGNSEFYGIPQGRNENGIKYYSVWDLLLPRIDFSRAYFKMGATFYNVKFHSDVSFEHAVFGHADFTFSMFEDDVTFGHSEFKGIARFPTIFKGGSNFENTIFHATALFLEEGDGIEEWIDLVSRNTFMFHGPLNFSHIQIHGGINIDIPSEWFKLPEAEIEARRVQRLSYEKEGKRDEADRMFVLEMRAKRRARIKNARAKLEKLKAHTHNFIEWLLADLPSEYGTNWVRLFLFSLLVIIGNAVPYAFWSTYIEGLPQTSHYLVRFANALYYSLVTFTTLGYGDMHPTGWLKALSALEALTGAVFMALIVAVIARKWMR